MIMDFKKILLAVDASENAMRAVEYTGSIAGSTKGFQVELFCVERLPHRDTFPDETAWAESCERTREELKTFMAQARTRLETLGMARESITDQYLISCTSPFPNETFSCSRGTSVAQDIMEAVRQGGFGTVVVGRRGVSKAEEFLFGSVSNKIIHSAKDVTVWVVS